MPDASLWQWLLMLVGAVFFLAAFAAAVSKLFEVVTKVAAPHFAHAVGEALKPQLEAINRELHTNGGKSIKDEVSATKVLVDQVANSVHEFIDYQHQNNHKVNNVLASTLGFIKLAHPEFAPEWDGLNRRDDRASG